MVDPIRGLDDLAPAAIGNDVTTATKAAEKEVSQEIAEGIEKSMNGLRIGGAETEASGGARVTGFDKAGWLGRKANFWPVVIIVGVIAVSITIAVVVLVSLGQAAGTVPFLAITFGGSYGIAPLLGTLSNLRYSLSSPDDQALVIENKDDLPKFLEGTASFTINLKENLQSLTHASGREKQATLAMLGKLDRVEVKKFKDVATNSIKIHGLQRSKKKKALAAIENIASHMEDINELHMKLICREGSARILEEVSDAQLEALPDQLHFGPPLESVEIPKSICKHSMFFRALFETKEDNTQLKEISTHSLEIIAQFAKGESINWTGESVEQLQKHLHAFHYSDIEELCESVETEISSRVNRGKLTPNEIVTLFEKAYLSNRPQLLTALVKRIEDKKIELSNPNKKKLLMHYKKRLDQLLDREILFVASDLSSYQTKNEKEIAHLWSRITHDPKANRFIIQEHIYSKIDAPNALTDEQGEKIKGLFQ